MKQEFYKADIQQNIPLKLQMDGFFKVNLDLLCITDTEGHLLKINQEWESVLGYPLQELTGKSFFSLIHPDDLQTTANSFRLLGEQQPLLSFVNRFQCNNGSYRYLEWRSQFQGKFIYASARDITEKMEGNQCLELMINSSKEFLGMSYKHIDYQKVTDTVLSLSGALCVTFNLYATNGSDFKTVAISGNTADIKKAESLLGFPLIGSQWTLSQAWHDRIQDEPLMQFNDLNDIAGSVLPLRLLNLLKQTYGMGQIIVAKITKDNRMLGNFTIIMAAGRLLQHSKLIKMYAQQVGLLLDRIKSEEALAKSEAMLEEAQSTARLGWWEWNHSSGMVSFSRGLNELFELALNTREMTYLQFLNLICPADQKKVRDITFKENGEPYEMVFQIKTGKGTTKWVQGNGRTLKEEKGNLIRTIGTVQDITKLKESEERIQKLLTDNEIIFNGTQDLLFLVAVAEGPSFVYIRNNAAHQAATGFSSEEFRGKTPQALFGTAKGKTIFRSFVRCLTNNCPISYTETLELPCGSRTWETTLTPVFENGKAVYIVGSSRDIKERNEFQKKLLSHLKRNRILVNVLQHPIETEQAYLDYALDQALALTQSKYGYIYLYDDKSETFTINSWSTEVMPACNIQEKQTKYWLKDTGIWGEVVRQKKAILINDFTKPHPLKKGYPLGHVNLTSFLSIPILDQNSIVAVVGVANKKADYTEDDILQLTLLMNNVWSVVQRKRSEDSLKREKELFKATLLSIGDGILATDAAGKITVINEVAQKLTGWPEKEAIGQYSEQVFQIINEKTGETCENPVSQVIRTGKITVLTNHTLLVSPNRSRRSITDSAAPIIGENGNVQGVVLAFRDVTQEKQKIEAIEYLSYHDQLTGLYNRAFFEIELKRLDHQKSLPLTIVMGDVNGLKLTNDAFGHNTGDLLLQKAAQVMQECCRTDDIIARIGGDEFIILLPQTTSREAEKIVEQIRRLCTRTFAGSVVLSISFGWANKVIDQEDIYEIRKNAEDMMYRNKLFESPSVRGKTIAAIIQTLYETHPREEAHSKRVAELSKEIATQLGFNERELKAIVSAALLHDIGKIAISGHILNKPGTLSLDEEAEIRRHPEIGYRILSSVNDLGDTAECILAHHERWDGTGYPKGIQGTDILLQARIIALADAFDAMTCNRPYRPALSRDEAIAQILSNAGKQFDPHLVKIFLSLSQLR